MKMIKCDICSEEHPGPTLSCETCNIVVNKYKHKGYSMVEVRKALKSAYSHKGDDNKESYFRCFYTGMESKFNNQAEKTLETFNDALILTLDHKNPDGKELVVSLNIINKMKTDVPSDKFKNIIIALGEYFNNESDRNHGKLEKSLKQICK